MRGAAFYFYFGGGSSDIIGSANQTLGNLTQSATGTILISGIATQQLSNLAQTAAGTVLISGTAAQQLAALTQTSAGTIQISGQAAQSMDSLMQFSAGTVAITGAAAQVLDALTQVATGYNGTGPVLSTIYVKIGGVWTATANKFGDAINYAEFEADGTLALHGKATGWLDIKFPQGVPKTSGAGNPTLVTYLGNQRGYAYAVNDANDFDPQEYDHNCKVGAPFTWHLHLILRANDASTRYLKFELERSYLAPNGVETQITPNATVEFDIAAGTTVLTGKLLDIISDTVANIGPGWMLSARVKRIAASGTAPSVDPIIKALHIHAEIDTPAGSRLITTK